MATVDVPLKRVRFGHTARKDGWWVMPLTTFVVFSSFVVYVTWALFQGGPGSAIETLPVYIFMTTWQYFEISKCAAMSYIVMMLMIVIVLIAIRLLQREKHALDAMYIQEPAES